MADHAAEGGSSRASEVVAATVAPGEGQAKDSLRVALDTHAARFHGFVNVDVVPPPSGDNSWTAVLTFESEAALQSWRESAEHAELLGRVRDAAGDQDWVLPNGFGQWSSGNDFVPVRAPGWKQAMMALAVIYAMVSILNITLGNFIGKGLSVEGSQVVPGLGLSLPVVVFVGNAVSTILLTWVVMPVVTRLLSWWLSPTATTAQTVRGVVLVLVIYLIEVLFFFWVFRTFGF